jgi:basic amino acid/polyamine antiporter, APA family
MQNQPKRQLSLVDAISIMVGIVIGVGIFESSPVVAASTGSFWGIIGIWLTGGFLSLAGALTYAELATAYPEEGGDYAYLKRAYGEWLAFLFIWGRFVVVQPGSIASMAYPFAKSILLVFPSFQFLGVTSIGLLAIATLTVVNITGARLGTVTQNILTLSKILAVLFIIIFALTGNHAHAKTIEFEANYGLALILALFAYGGWNEIVFVAGEVKNPNKNIIKSLIYSVLLITIIYIIFNISLMMLLGVSGLATTQSLGQDVFAQHALSFYGERIFGLIVAVSSLAAMNGLIFTGARLSYVLGKNHKFFSSLGVFLITGTFSESVVYTTTVVWLFFLASACSLKILRNREPDLWKNIPYLAYPYNMIILASSSIYLVYSSFLYDIKGCGISLVVLLFGYLLFKYK